MVQRLFPPEYLQEQSQKFRSYRRFLKGINRKTTKESYTKHLFNFMKFHHLINYDEVTKLKTDKLDILLEDYIDFIEQRDNKGTSVKTSIAGIELFFTMNDCIWHDKRIRKEIKKDDVLPGGQVPITTEEVNRMIECTNSLRSKAIVHFLASTGARPGALIDPVLRMKHLVSMAHPTDTSIQRYCYAIKVYDESKEGYWAFLTPEAVKSLDNYFEWRRQQGEIFTEDTPVFGLVDKRNAKHDHMTDKNVRYRLDELIKKAAVKRIKVSHHRYDKAIVYMFRKRFNTILKLRNDLNSNIAEKLMAHKKGLDGTYLQPTREECYTEFVKAISELTVDQSQRLQEEVREQNQEISELKKQKTVIQEQAIEMEMLKDEMKRQKEMIESIKNNN